MSSIRWLHLTDFHQGMGSQKWLWPGMRERVFEDLARLQKKMGGPWDLVLFTGDLTQRGSTEEFQYFEDSLARLWAHLQELGSNPLLLAVPGNHDLVRPVPRKATVKALGTWWSDPDISDEFWKDDTSDYRRLVAEAFKPYGDWQRASRFHGQPLTPGLLPGDFSFTFPKDGVKLGVVGLNSAFLQLTAEDFKEKLALDPRQFQAACGGDSSDWLAKHDATILLTHHPQDWLHSQAAMSFEQEILAGGNFTLHLFGHMHRGASGSIRRGGGTPHRFIQGPSLFGLEEFGGNNEVQRIHGYMAGRIDFEESGGRLSIWPRVGTLKEGNFRMLGPDPTAILDEREAWSEPFTPRRMKHGRLSAPPSAPTAPGLPSSSAEPGAGTPSMRSQLSAGDYTRLHGRARLAVERLSTIAEQLGWHSVSDQGQELLKVLHQEPYRVVITGKSRAGKSTLLNALVGRAICPARRSITTAVPIIIKPGEKEFLTVNIKGKSPRLSDGPITQELLAPYADQQNNPDNEKKVIDIQVELTNEVLDLGVMYVDIPGFDDPTSQIWSSTMEMLQTAHALVLVLDVSSVRAGGFALDKQTRELLQRAQARQCAVFVVCNKADQLNAEQTQEAKEMVRSDLKRFGVWSMLAHPPFFLSASEVPVPRTQEMADPSAFKAFYDALWESLWKTEAIGLRRLYQVFEQLRLASDKVATLIASRRAQEPERIKLGAALQRCEEQRKEIVEDCIQAIKLAQSKGEQLMQTARTELRDEVRKWVEALPAGQDLPKPSAGVDALKDSMLQRRNQIVEQVQQKLEDRLARIDRRMRESLAELRSEAGSSAQTRQMQGLAQTLSTWKGQMELSAPDHQGRQVARFASMASFGIAALTGQLFGVGGLLATVVTWAINVFTDSAETPAELEEDVARTFERDWEQFATNLEQRISELSKLVTQRIRSNMMSFMKDMRSQLDDIREATQEELHLFEQLKTETEQATVSLQAILRAAQ
ncbi:dynamin family protein [Corallococcus exiguus]|uniref:dynamin family protein n=1 Tax=Corallococcus exiguus TaxID=83462 RepID=UPI00155F7009|nr:dynamin family protein [Corallococcus exiguus]NRD46155.1 dynamin family protein [Corallococcus exiguus]